MKRESYQLHWRTLLALMMLAGAFQAPAQSTVEMREIITRLDRLEKENQALTEEVRGLRQMLASRESITSQSGAVAAADPVAPPAAEEAAPTEERLSLLQNRIDELAQTKVETSQKFPLRITGMALFNAYVNGRHNNNADNPTVASFGPADSTGAATLRQSTIGILFSGPQAVLGAKVSGSMYMDFFAGSAASLNHLFRIRTAAINFDWSRTKFSVGQDKPLISPRDPESLAQVGVSPLTSAGNPWLWQPQARFEQRFSLGSNSGLRAQAGVFQTSISNATTDPNAYVPPPPGQRVEFSRPGAEGRVEFWRQWGETERIELAGGFHYNANRVGDVSLPSEVYSIDWFVRPVAKLEISGLFFRGQNVSTLGALRQGFTLLPNGQLLVVHSNGGWAQLRIPITSRLAFNIYGGQQDDRNRDLLFGSIAKNQAYFSNLMYRFAPNVIVSLEGGQVRTTYLGAGNRLNDHYDLAVAYLF